MSEPPERWSDTQVALVDLIDRVIGGGVVINGDVVLGVAGVDLVYLGLRLVLAPAHEVDQSIALGKGPA
jgi:Gas vesicle protein